MIEKKYYQKYERGKISFDCIVRDAPIKEEDVVGYIDFRKAKKDEDAFTVDYGKKKIKYGIVYLKSSNYRESTKNKRKKKIPNSIEGYLEIEDGKFIAICPTQSLFLLILLLSLLALLLFYQRKDDIDDFIPTLDIADDSDWDGDITQNVEPEVITDSIEIPGYANLFVTSDMPNIKLVNPEINSVYLQYFVKDKDGNVLYDSQAIRPGKMVNVNFYELLKGEKKTHNLTFDIKTYDLETNAECNGAIQKVEILVK